MRKIILAALALLTASPAVGQAWEVGQQPVVYPTNRFPVIGDGSTTYGGIAPRLSTMPAKIPTSQFLLSDFSASDVQFTTPPPGTGEAKLRLVCGGISHFSYDDPILFPGMRGMSHLHAFFGNTLTSANSTYATLRKSGRSNCPGDAAANRTGYWQPAVLKTINGQKFAVRADQSVVYYTQNPIEGSAELTDIPTDLAFITGPDPMSGYVDRTQTEVNTANNLAAASGQPMRYATLTTGFVGWKCENPIGTQGQTAFSPLQGAQYDHQPYLRTAAGQPTLNCNPKMPNGTDTAFIVAEWNAPDCWDGKNSHSPDGRSHVRQAVRATNTATSATKIVCPDTFYKMPQLIIGTYFGFTDQADYTAWSFSSDANSTYTYQPGQTGHMDWMNGWDYDVMLRWMHFCLGTMGNVAHECNYATIDASTRLLSDSQIPVSANTGYRDPPGSIRNGRIVDNDHDWIRQGMKRFVPVPQGPYMIHAH